MIRIANGRVYDPMHGENGVLRDVWLDDGFRICPPSDAPHETFDAAGCAVMAGAIDIHSHIAGEPLNLLRDMGNPIVPTARQLGADYARMGYTLAANAAMPALAARRTLLEECEIPDLHTANLVWAGENPALLSLAESGSNAELDDYLSWLLSISGGWGLKLIDPRDGQTDGPLPYEKLIDRLIDANERLGLSHPLHLHHPYLGRQGAYTEVIRTMERADGRRLHLAHLQFYGYRLNESGHIASAAEALARAINDCKSITADAGAVVFGPAAAVTADANFAKKLGSGKHGFRSALWERDGGFGVLPLRYDKDNVMGATQFITGLSLLLLCNDPERMFLTTDHPNGGPFTAYPYLIRLLTDRAFRLEQLSELNPKALSRSGVQEITRTYTLYDIARMTRSGPAKHLGLSGSFGHLGVGASGGAIVYRPCGDDAAMFAAPAAVFCTPPRIHAAALRPFDAACVEKRIEPYLGVPFADAQPSDAFFTRCNVVREVL